MPRTEGAEETLRNAQIVFDPFHVTALVGTAVDEVRRREAREGEDGVKTLLKGSMYLFARTGEPDTPTSRAARRHGPQGLAPGQTYQVRLELSDITERLGKRPEGALPPWRPGCNGHRPEARSDGRGCWRLWRRQ